jgi:hypothetical protein
LLLPVQSTKGVECLCSFVGTASLLEGSACQPIERFSIRRVALKQECAVTGKQVAMPTGSMLRGQRLKGLSSFALGALLEGGKAIVVQCLGS